VSSSDRVAVPTNGHHPALTDDALDAPHHDATGSDDRPAEPAETSTAMPAVTPGQVIAGFGVLAALALLLVGRRRGRG
jgi:hypothetical protein